MRYYYLDPVTRDVCVVPGDDPITWALLRADPLADIVKQTPVGPFWVSTVFLGLDYGYSFLGGPSLFFETMVFEQEISVIGAGPAAGSRYHASLDLDDEIGQQRYCTYREALRGHGRVCRAVRRYVGEEMTR
jgi:hypothetical protein